MELCLRSTCFWLLVCLMTGYFLGWPLLLTGAGLVWGMWRFCTQVGGD